MVRAPAAVSVSMGFCLMAPRGASRAFGLRGNRAAVVRAIAARDLGIGLGLFGLVPGGQRLWLLAHLLANVVDGALVAWWLSRGDIARVRGAAWLGLAVGGAVTAAWNVSGPLGRRGRVVWQPVADPREFACSVLGVTEARVVRQVAAVRL